MRIKPLKNIQIYLTLQTYQPLSVLKDRVEKMNRPYKFEQLGELIPLGDGFYQFLVKVCPWATVEQIFGNTGVKIIKVDMAEHTKIEHVDTHTNVVDLQLEIEQDRFNTLETVWAPEPHDATLFFRDISWRGQPGQYHTREQQKTSRHQILKNVDYTIYTLAKFFKSNTIKFQNPVPLTP